MSARFLNNPAYYGVEGVNYVWYPASPLVYYDRHGHLCAVPERFHHDKRSSWKIMWPWLPPSVGAADRAWTVHDFEQRCYALLGLRLSDVDGYRFRDAITSVGKTERRAKWHSYGVRLNSFFRGPVGDGWYGDDWFDQPVWDELLHKMVPLCVWVRSHYNQDGTGLNDEAAEAIKARINV